MTSSGVRASPRTPRRPLGGAPQSRGRDRRCPGRALVQMGGRRAKGPSAVYEHRP